MPDEQSVIVPVVTQVAGHVPPVRVVGLVVLGGGIGANGALLLPVVRSLLEQWLPYPPRVEISALGDAAVLTGALSVALDAALDNVFVNRPRPLVARCPLLVWKAARAVVSQFE